ncbi:helix-turn-helix transcriptional regulator [Paenibacillus filicis]|uniref:Helix-turn-helix transcriptional regulator n=1 Tax=Paenibacillus filicis TaxID=669464 RepID=A0ABU9DXF7_9BACL
MTGYKITIRQARELAGMSLEEAAQAAGISVKWLKWYERHASRIPYQTALDLAKAYEQSISAIHFGTQEGCDEWNLSLMRKDVIQYIVKAGISPEKAEKLLSTVDAELQAAIRKKDEVAV